MTEVKQKKDKQKVLGVDFTAEMLQVFIDYKSPNSNQIEFDALQRAYRGLPESAFAEFIRLFKEQGHDIDAKNELGITFSDQVRKHPAFKGYLAILEAAAGK